MIGCVAAWRDLSVVTGEGGEEDCMCVCMYVYFYLGACESWGGGVMVRGVPDDHVSRDLATLPAELYSRLSWRTKASPQPDIKAQYTSR